MLFTFCPCWFMLFSWSCQSQILDLLVIKATLVKINFCIIGQIISFTPSTLVLNTSRNSLKCINGILKCIRLILIEKSACLGRIFFTAFDEEKKLTFKCI